MVPNAAEHGGGSGRAAAELTVGETLVRGILDHRTVTFSYHGLQRTVEPHLVGVHPAGEAVLVGYQTEGSSHSGELPGWRTFIISEISDAHLDDRMFLGPRPEFNPNDQRMTEIFARA
jgi:hypothetical protein